VQSKKFLHLHVKGRPSALTIHSQKADLRAIVIGSLQLRQENR